MLNGIKKGIGFIVGIMFSTYILKGIDFIKDNYEIKKKHVEDTE